MRWVTCVTAPILLADVGDYRFEVEFPISAYRALTESYGCQCLSMGDFRGSGDEVATYRQKDQSTIG